VVSVQELLKEYIDEGRIKLDPSVNTHTITVHDPCNYVRKSQMTFGDHMGHLNRWITQQCVDPSLYREMVDDPLNNHCCGAGGGAWAMPYDDERLAYGKVKADQIKDTGAEIVMAPCHNCRDQIMKGLPKVHDMGNYHETLYLWELVANTLVVEPWSEEEVEKAHAERDAQYERDGIDLEEEEY